MKCYLTAAAVLLLGGNLLAQSLPAVPTKPKGPSADDLQKKLEDKLAQPFLKKAPWLTDFDKAKAEAKKSNKLLFVYFSRSYAY
ncbi:MAG: hypothetical protein ACKVS6_16500 [Planctomycetota bacterium]